MIGNITLANIERTAKKEHFMRINSLIYWDQVFFSFLICVIHTFPYAITSEMVPLRNGLYLPR